MTRYHLTLPAIVDASLAVLADGRPLSMRTVADELGVSTMAAYRHVDGRNELGLLALGRALELHAKSPRARDPQETELDDLVLDAIFALEPYPGLGEELAHAFDPEGEPPHALASWSTTVADRYGPAAVRLASWLIRGALERGPDPAARALAVRAAADVAIRHDARKAGHTALGVAKPTADPNGNRNR